MNQTIVALFDNRADAEAAVGELVKAGVDRTSIGITSGRGERYAASATSSYDYGRDEGGFWASLKDLFMPEEDRYAYAEGLNRGWHGRDGQDRLGTRCHGRRSAGISRWLARSRAGGSRLALVRLDRLFGCRSNGWNRWACRLDGTDRRAAATLRRAARTKPSRSTRKL